MLSLGLQVIGGESPSLSLKDIRPRLVLGLDLFRLKVAKVC